MKYFALIVLFSFVVSTFSFQEVEKEIKHNEDNKGMKERGQIDILTNNFRERIRKEEENHMTNGTSNGIIDIWKKIKEGFRKLGWKMLTTLRVFLTPRLEQKAIEISKHYFYKMVWSIERLAKKLANAFISDLVSYGKIPEIIAVIKKALVELVDHAVKRIIEIIDWLIRGKNYGSEIDHRIISVIISIFKNQLKSVWRFVKTLVKEWLHKLSEKLKRFLVVVWHKLEKAVDEFVEAMKWINDEFWMPIWAVLKPVLQRLRDQIKPLLWRVKAQILEIYHHRLPPHAIREIIAEARSGRSQGIIYDAVHEFMKGWMAFLAETNSHVLKGFYPISIEITHYIRDFILDHLKTENKNVQPLREWIREMIRKIVRRSVEIAKKVFERFAWTFRHVEPYLNMIDTIVPRQHLDQVGNTMWEVAQAGLRGVFEMMKIVVNEVAKDMIEGIKSLIGDKYYNYISDFIGDSSEYSINHGNGDDVGSIKAFVAGKCLNVQDKDEANCHFTLWQLLYLIIIRVGRDIGKVLFGIGSVVYDYGGRIHDVVMMLVSKGVHEGKPLLIDLLADIIKIIISA